MEEKRKAYMLLEGERPLGKPRRRRVDEIKTSLGEMG
jgi:hypothetical protein